MIAGELPVHLALVIHVAGQLPVHLAVVIAGELEYLYSWLR